MDENGEIEASPQKDDAQTEQSLRGKRQTAGTGSTFPNKRFAEHSGNQGQRDAAEMIEQRKVCEETGENREEGGDKHFSPELKATKLHEPSIANFRCQNNQLIG